MTDILIIEDEDVLLYILQEKLEKEGFSVAIARNGKEGLEKARETQPKLILLDLVMPEMDGFEVIETLENDKNISSASVIVISNSGNEQEAQKLREIGVEDYLVKANFSPQEVMEKVQKYVRTHDDLEKNGSGAEKQNDEVETEEKKSGNEDETRVVVIEDEQYLRDIISAKLLSAGFQVFSAEDGETGLEYIQKNKPGAILLDLLLPGMHGFEVLKEVKSDPDLKSIPVIIVSNFSAQEEIDKAMELGVKSYLIKSNLDPEDIITELNQVLSKESE